MSKRNSNHLSLQHRGSLQGPRGYSPTQLSDLSAWNLQKNVWQKSFLHLFKFWSTQNTEILRNVLHLVVVPVVGFGFPIRFLWIWVLLFLGLDLGILIFRVYWYWWEVPLWNVHKSYKNSPSLFNISNFVFLIPRSVYIIVKLFTESRDSAKYVTDFCSLVWYEGEQLLW